MTVQKAVDYDRIAQAIEFIKTNFKQQPSLESISAEVHLSPFHFQRLFTEWAGTSPKKFLQYLTVEHAKKLLSEHKATLFDTACESGLSGTGRLHDLFISIEGMTPAEYKNGGKNLTINYSTALSPFGKLFLASTHTGICYMAFCENEADAFSDLQQKFQQANFRAVHDEHQKDALLIFQQKPTQLNLIKLHLKGTPFQLKVWQSLLQIPFGKLATYGHIAAHIGNSGASRAVGTAIAGNPVAYLIPCHRVIRSGGEVGGYMWGSTRKSAMIGWESAQLNPA